MTRKPATRPSHSRVNDRQPSAWQSKSAPNRCQLTHPSRRDWCSALPADPATCAASVVRANNRPPRAPHSHTFPLCRRAVVASKARQSRRQSAAISLTPTTVAPTVDTHLPPCARSPSRRGEQSFARAPPYSPTPSVGNSHCHCERSAAISSAIRCPPYPTTVARPTDTRLPPCERTPSRRSK